MEGGEDMKFSSIEEEKAYFDRSTWPCGKGMCRSCGILSKIPDGWSCATYLKNGETCPNEYVESHLWGGGMACILCGQKRGWVAPNGEHHINLVVAKKAGWSRHELRLEP